MWDSVNANDIGSNSESVHKRLAGDGSLNEKPKSES